LLTTIPYKRLSLFYFCYYGLLGVTHPFWTIFLVSRDFSPAEIGVIFSMQMVTRIVSPNLWGWLADRCGSPMTAIRLGSLLAAVTFAGIFSFEDYWGMILVMAAYSFFWHGVMPLFEAITLDYVADEPQNYSRIRKWGSVGFIVSVLFGGFWFQDNIADFRLVCLLFLVFIWVSTLFVREPESVDRQAEPDPFVRVLLKKPVVAFLVASLLIQLAHGIYYTLYSLHLEQAGYSRPQIGLFWALSVVAEIVLFSLMPRLMTNWSLRGILLFCLVISAVRWIIIGFFAQSVTMLILAQCLHAFSFGGCHAISMEYLRRFFAGSHSGKGQAVYTSFSFGVGGALGAISGGLLWDYSGTLTFSVASIISLSAAALIYRALDYRRQQPGKMRDLLQG